MIIVIFKGENKMSIGVRLSDNLINEAKILAKVENRSVPGQIEYWAKIGKVAEQNPDLPFNLIREILIGLEELDSGQGIEYKFG
jgi:hypothetical protein